MDAKIFIGVILLLIGAYTIVLALNLYELSFIPSSWIIIASGAVVAIYSLKYFKSNPSTSPAPTA